MDSTLTRCTLAELSANPVGRFCAGEGWLHFYRSDQLSGIVLWGQLAGDDVAAFGAMAPIAASRGATDHVSYVDARRVTGIQPSAFAVAADFYARNREALKRSLSKLALVHGAGLPAVVAHGFYRVVRPPHRFRLFSEPEAALAWLGVADAATEPQQYDAAYDEVASVALVRDLRAAANAHEFNLSLPQAARMLRVSVRTLQRRLRDASTSFQHEIDLARVRRAQERLLDGTVKLDVIAEEVGCASRQHLAVLFRRVAGLSPARWREARLGG